MGEATKCARQLLGCYRTGDANDPEIYITAVVTVLANYPPEIMRAVCDPMKGLPAQTKWLPTIAEVVELCQKLHGYDRAAEERKRKLDEQFAARRALPNWAKRLPHNALTYAQAQEMIQENPSIKILGIFDEGRTIPYRG